MADASAQAEIRGIDIDKLAKGFADEVLILKKFVQVTNTSAREIRWYAKTAGFLDSSDSTGMTDSQIANTSSKSLPVVVEPSWDRTSSYVRKYFVESPYLSDEDIKDSDIDVLATNVRDLVKAVANQVDTRIGYVLSDVAGTGGHANTAAATADGWDDDVTGNPIADILTAIEQIRTYRYDTRNLVMILHPGDHTSLINYLINVKGSSIPNFSSDKVKTGVVQELLGVSVAVSVNASEDTAIIFVPKIACTWKQFTPLTTAVIKDPGIGTKIRVWEEGEAILHDPRAVAIITDIKV